MGRGTSGRTLSRASTVLYLPEGTRVTCVTNWRFLDHGAPFGRSVRLLEFATLAHCALFALVKLGGWSIIILEWRRYPKEKGHAERHDAAVPRHGGRIVTQEQGCGSH